VSLLEVVACGPLEGQIREPPPPVEIGGEQEWGVEEVLDSMMIRRHLRYLIKWTGREDPSWEPAENVNELRAIDVFHQHYPGKPGPLLE
jgi:hypothetical protein